MDVSIIVCCFKGYKTIFECLKSLDRQDYNNKLFEVVLIDDGSSDGTSQIIKSYLEHRKNSLPSISYYRKHNEGLSVARNYGIEKSTGRYVSFIDEDACVNRDFVSMVYQSFVENPQVNCLGGKVDIWNDKNRFARVYHYGIFNAMMQHDTVIGTNMSFPKSFLVEIGGFEGFFSSRGDESALFLIAGNRLKVLINENVIVFHSQPESMSHFFSVRSQNGKYQYFHEKLAVTLGKGKIISIIKSIYHIVYFSAPVVFTVLVVFDFRSLIMSLLIYTGLLLFRYLWLGHLINPLKEIGKSRIDNKFGAIFLTIFLVVRGFRLEDKAHVKEQLKSALKL